MYLPCTSSSELCWCNDIALLLKFFVAAALSPTANPTPSAQKLFFAACLLALPGREAPPFLTLSPLTPPGLLPPLPDPPPNPPLLPFPPLPLPPRPPLHHICRGCIRLTQSVSAVRLSTKAARGSSAGSQRPRSILLPGQSVKCNHYTQEPLPGPKCGQVGTSMAVPWPLLQPCCATTIALKHVRA